MRINEMTKALNKYKSVEEAAKVLGITARTLYVFKSELKDKTMTTENNKLIAEFMGWGEDNGFLFPPNDKSMNTIDGWYSKDIPYHTSWDWLMPVISKCFKTGDDTHQWDNIMDTIFTCDINITYKQVVEFIKEYNN